MPHPVHHARHRPARRPAPALCAVLCGLVPALGASYPDPWDPWNLPALATALSCWLCAAGAWWPRVRPHVTGALFGTAALCLLVCAFWRPAGTPELLLASLCPLLLGAARTVHERGLPDAALARCAERLRHGPGGAPPEELTRRLDEILELLRERGAEDGPAGDHETVAVR